MNKILIAVVAIIVIVGGVFFFLRKSAPTQNQAASEPNTVTISNFSFSPNSLTVKAGTTVTWVNQDSATHTIKSDIFNSGNLGQGDKFTFTFATPGTFNYSCGIHPTMTGKIIVD